MDGLPERAGGTKETGKSLGAKNAEWLSRFKSRGWPTFQARRRQQCALRELRRLSTSLRGMRAGRECHPPAVGRIRLSKHKTCRSLVVLTLYYSGSNYYRHTHRLSELRMRGAMQCTQATRRSGGVPRSPMTCFRFLRISCCTVAATPPDPLSALARAWSDGTRSGNSVARTFLVRSVIVSAQSETMLVPCAAHSSPSTCKMATCGAPRGKQLGGVA